MDKKQKEIDEITQETKAGLQKIVSFVFSIEHPKDVPTQSSSSKFIKYKSSQQFAPFNSGMLVDTLEPTKFKHKRVPKTLCCPPLPLMYSPPLLMSVKDYKDNFVWFKVHKEIIIKDKKKNEMELREDERERMLEAMNVSMGKKSKLTRDGDHNINKKVALGMTTTKERRGEAIYDQRLSKKENDDEMDGGVDEQLENLRKTERFRSRKAFLGTS
ncbi:hypothetical protein Pfo_010918 [Paulownia fortunei]|nr:hypothetical protein Pfo_010918 [Paulownia fortunei]